MEMRLAIRPMKKAILILAVIGVLVLAGVVLFKRGGGPSKASHLAPVETVFYANIPNVPMTGFRWQKTALAKIAAEPEVAAFLKRPTGKVMEATGAEELIEIFTALKPGNLFFCVTEELSTGVGALLGVQFWGKREDFDKALKRLRDVMPGWDGNVIEETHRGIVMIGTRHADRMVWSAAAGRWGLVATDSGLLRGAIDRATGAEGAVGMSSSIAFTKVVSALPSEPDMFVYLRPDKALDSFLQAGQGIGGTVIPWQADSLRGAEAMGAVWKMDGERQRDAVYFLRPRDVAALPKLAHSAMGLTNADTDFYFDFVLNFDALPGWLETMAESFPDETLRLAPFVMNLSRAFGPECAVVGDWPAGQMLPSAFVALQVRDAEMAAPFPAFVAANVPGGIYEEVDGVRIATLPGAQGAFSLVQTDSLLLAGRNAASLVALVTASPGNATLAGTRGFEPAMRAYRSANEMFGYIDTRVVFENIYNTVVPIVRLSALMMPSVSNVVDVESLPAAGTIGKHLGPIVVTQSVTAEGTLLESRGPLSLGQFLMIGVAASRSADLSAFGR